MTTREATVINRASGSPFLDMDPVDVETTADGTAYPQDENLMRIFDAMVNTESETELVLLLVWSDTLFSRPVQARCPKCFNDYRVDDEMMVEELDNGSSAMVCCHCID